MHFCCFQHFKVLCYGIIGTWYVRAFSLTPNLNQPPTESPVLVPHPGSCLKDIPLSVPHARSVAPSTP